MRIKEIKIKAIEIGDEIREGEFKIKARANAELPEMRNIGYNTKDTICFG